MKHVSVFIVAVALFANLGGSLAAPIPSEEILSPIKFNRPTSTDAFLGRPPATPVSPMRPQTSLEEGRLGPDAVSSATSTVGHNSNIPPVPPPQPQIGSNLQAVGGQRPALHINTETPRLLPRPPNPPQSQYGAVQQSSLPNPPSQARSRGTLPVPPQQPQYGGVQQPLAANPPSQSRGRLPNIPESVGAGPPPQSHASGSRSTLPLPPPQVQSSSTRPLPPTTRAPRPGVKPLPTPGSGSK